MKRRRGDRSLREIHFLFLFLAVFFAIEIAFAGDSTEKSQSMEQVQSALKSATSEAQMKTGGLSGQNQSPSAHQASAATASGNAMGMAMSGAMAAAEGAMSAQEISTGMSCTPAPCMSNIAMGTMLAVMAAQSLAQMAQHDKAKQGADMAAGLTSSGLNNSTGFGKNPFHVGNYDSVGINKKIEDYFGKNPDGTLKGVGDGKLKTSDITKSLDLLKNNKIAGVKFDPKKNTISIDGGKETRLQDLTTKEAFVEAGIPSSIVDSALAKANKVGSGIVADVQKLNAERNGGMPVPKEVEESGSGSLGGGSRTGAASAAVGPSGRRGLASLPGGVGPGSVAGMQKKFNGEPIGVAADNIFKMIQRRYQSQDRQNKFFDEAEAAAFKK